MERRRQRVDGRFVSARGIALGSGETNCVDADEWCDQWNAKRLNSIRSATSGMCWASNSNAVIAAFPCASIIAASPASGRFDNPNAAEQRQQPTHTLNKQPIRIRVPFIKALHFDAFASFRQVGILIESLGVVFESPIPLPSDRDIVKHAFQHADAKTGNRVSQKGDLE